MGQLYLELVHFAVTTISLGSIIGVLLVCADCCDFSSLGVRQVDDVRVISFLGLDRLPEEKVVFDVGERVAKVLVLKVFANVEEQVSMLLHEACFTHLAHVMVIIHVPLAVEGIPQRRRVVPI